MAEHNFSELFSHYPAVITQMNDTFTSHEFILELARQNQVLYIEALYAYRHQVRINKPAPFMIVHGQLARHLFEYPNLITQLRKDAPSKDIFNQDNWCSKWKKVN